MPQFIPPPFSFWDLGTHELVPGVSFKPSVPRFVLWSTMWGSSAVTTTPNADPLHTKFTGARATAVNKQTGTAALAKLAASP